jgi:spermidine synthase
MGALSLFLFRDKTHPAIQIPASIVVIVVISVFLFVNISRPTSALMSSESPYYFTHVYDAPLQKATDTRWLFLDFDSHSVDTKGVRLGLYTDMAYVFNDLLVENNPNVLVLGAGAYTIPKILAEEMPQASIDVIEIDPSLETIGRDYFDLGNYPTIQTQTGDPRYLLPNTEKTYDLIFNDVYNSFISVPSHLVTTEFLDQIKKNLNDTGMYAMGFIGTNQGQGRAVAEHIVTTAQHVFADVRVIFFGRTDAAISSFVLLASQTSIPQSDEDLKKIISTTVPELSHVSFVTIDTPTRLLTDHWQPLENLMRPLMKRYFPRYKEIYYRVTNPRV